MKQFLLCTVLLCTMLFGANTAKAQTTLATGDIAFIGYSSNASPAAGDTFSFVLLTNISANTQISITDRGYNGSTWVGAGSTEGTITWTSGSALPIGTQVMVQGLVAYVYNSTLGQLQSNGSLSLTEGTSPNGLSLSNVGDQLIAFQGGGGSVTGSGVTFIAGFHALMCNANTSSALWDNAGCTIGPNSSTMPPNLTGGFSAFATLVNSAATTAKFICTTPYSTVSALRSAIMDKNNWDIRTTTGGVGLPVTCAVYSSCTSPTITSNPPNRSICVNGNTTFTGAATGATAYQWQVNTGSGFSDITNGGVYSGATTTTLTITGATSIMNGYLYRMVAINGGATCFTNTNNATLNISNITSNTAKNDVLCFGNSSGSAAVSPSGGIGSYTYSWAPSGGTASIATGLAANTYTVSITDAISCSISKTITINQPASALNTTAGSKTDVSCNGGSNGTATVAPTGGTPAYTYSWAPSGGTAATATGLPVGNYTVTITDANNCQATRGFTITQPTALNTTAGSKTDVSCNGGGNGTATVSPTGGTPAYTYSWAPSGGTNATATGLSAGTYTVVVTDANACQGTKTFTITQPTAINTTAGSKTDVSCNGGGNGTATVAPTGGTPAYTYSWAPSGGTNATATGLSAGTYTVVVTDANACTGIKTFTITQPTAINTTAGSKTDVSCNGGGNGTATVAPTGGTPVYSYSWAPSGGTNATATGLSAGTYTVVVTDANACTGIKTFTIAQPSAITSFVSLQTNIACNGGSNGSATITASGGTGTKTYSWAPSGGTAATATGLTAGVYTVSIQDANTCSKTQTVSITQPTALSLTPNSQTNIACNGGSTGAASVNAATGGAGGYTYNWTPGNPTGDGTTGVTGLTAGTWTVVVTDANSCTATRTFNITQPPALNGSTVVTNVACFGGNTGAINLTPAGGAGPYTFNWLPSGPTTEDRTSLTAGTYTVQITDANSCTGTVTATVTQPASAVSGTTVVTNVACFGGNTGAINLTPAGGTGPYTFNWLPSGPTTEDRTSLTAGTYTVQITDANSCTGTVTATVTQPASTVSGTTVVTNVACFGGNTGAINLTPAGGTGPYTFNWLPSGPTTEDRTSLVAGTYSVQITDANSCTGTVTATVTQPASTVNGTTVVTNVACNGGNTGAINLTPVGGVGPYTFNWLPGGPTTEDRTNLTAGTYTVQITDANSCTGTVTATLTQPTALSASTSSTNATCSAADGSASVSVSGGESPYFYSWAPSGGTGATATGLAAGTYTVTIIDDNSCQTTRTVTVGTTVNLVVTPSQTNVSCNGGSNGTATVSVTGGSTPYTYSWGPSGGTNATATGLAAGTYTVTITDNVACQTTQTVTLTQPAAIVGTSVTTNVACFSGANGAINFTANGGTSPYTFAWNNGTITEDISGLVAGTYTVIVTDANNCTASFSTTVSQPTALAPSTSVTNSLCSGLSNGSIDLTVSGGTASYTYLWATGATTEDISGLADGTYTVTITDANGCTATASAIVQSPVAVSTTTTVTNVNCNGGNNGKVVLNPTGGTTPYTYAWSTGATIDSIVNRTAGSYSYTVTDANSCNVTGSVSITQPTVLAINTTVTDNVLCYGESTGAIDATVTGGVTPYTYNWSNGTHNEDLTNALAGSYTLAVVDANNCQISKGAGTITQPATALSFVLDSTKDVNCNSATTGSIYTTVSGGTSPYTILWSNGSTADDATGLAAGSYSVTVTDDNGCSASVSATLTQPTLLTFDTTVTNISCYGAATGSIDVEVAGGTFPYQFAWSNASTSEDLSNLIAGSYSLTITDGAGCTLPTGPIVVSQSPNFGGTLDSLKNVTCFGLSNGAIYLTAAGATPPYTYLWSNGATTDDIVNVVAGAYVLTITDALGCNFNTPALQVSQPIAPLAAAVNIANNLTCNSAANGSIDITVTGGTASYMYMWSNGAITEDVVGLTAGAYQVTVTDANGCTAVSQSVTLTEPSSLTAGIVTQAASCNGTATGTANLTVSGGTTAYSFVWSNGAITEDITGLIAGTYTVTITDANSCSLSVSANVTEPALLVATAVPTDALCNAANGSVDLTVTGGTQPYGYNWSNSTTAEDLASVAAGTYSVTVNDNNGCIANTSVTVTQPTAIAITNTVLDVACNGGADGEIDIEVSGGTGAYSYAWSTSDNTQDVTGLTEGSYAVTVTDANSCTASATFTVAEPTAITLSTVADDASCNGGADGDIDLTVAGGTAPYSYVWSNAATTQDVTGLNAGTYTVTVTDDNSCVNIVSATVSEPTALALSTQVTHVQCFAGNNGAIDLTVSGGTATYTYVWSNAATTEDITGLVANTYNVTVTDANTCSASAAIVVGEPTLLTASAVASPALCKGGTGLVDVIVTGGAPAYTFAWSNAATTEDITDVAGAYTVTVTDNRQCTATATATVSQPSAITVQTQVTNATCPGGANGVVDITVAGGTGAYTYVWSNGTTMQDASGLTAGTYSVTITDANGCIVTASATVNEPAAIAAAANVQNVTCNGTGDGSITVSVSGGTGSYAYVWSNGANTANIGGLAGGAYTLTITDYNLCTAVFGPYTVVEPLPIVAVLDSFDVVSCFGASTGNVYVTVAGGTTPYTFAWSNGATTEDLIGVPAGIYTGTVTDVNGCQFTSPQIPVTGPTSALATSINSVVNVSCNGLADGEVMVSTTGGSSPYTYAWSNNGTGDMIMGVVAGTYTVSVTDANGCSVTVSATVNQPAVLTATATGTDVSCEGGSNGAVAVTTTGGTTPYTTVWSSGTTTGLVAGTYDVTVTDANQCSTTATVDLTFINTNPVVDLGADVTQCGGTVTLDAGIANANYAWSNGGTAQTTVVGASTSYSVIVTTTEGCTGTDTVQVTINAIPQVSFNVADTVCLNATPITLTASPAGGTFAGTLVSGDVFTPSAAGEQAVTYTYTDANNCSASAGDTILVNVCVGIEDIALATRLNVYPVPNTGAFTVAGSSFVSCQLTNNLGQALQYFELNADNNYTYAVQNLSAGVYYVVANNGNASATYKVLVIE